MKTSNGFALVPGAGYSDRRRQCGRYVLALLMVVLLSTGFAAGEAAATENARLVASTAWVGAMAEAAGAEDLRVLAPAELRHPPEYDFAPRDVGFAAEADLLIWAGYEDFMENLFEAADISDDRTLLIRTSNVPPLMAEAVETIAVELGTEDQFRRWKSELDQLADELLSAADAAGVADTPVAVHFHQRGFAEWLGFEVVAEFGPAEMTPGELASILAEGPELIIDNWHIPHGQPLRGGGRRYTTLINFPGSHGTASLFDVLRYNAEQLELF